MAKVTTSDIKNGLTIYQDSQIYQVIEFLHVKPGKGAAFVRTKLKGVVNGKVIDRTFKISETFESVRVERHEYSYLYNDGQFLHIMHKESFEQIMIESSKLDRIDFLKENETLQVVINADDNSVLFAELPPQVYLKIAQTTPGAKGDTVTNATKSATLETGAEIQVPLFINEGDIVKVDTEKGAYIERMKA